MKLIFSKAMIKQKGLCPSQEGIFVLRIDGKPYATLDLAEGDTWRKRRHMLTPAFSSGKLRLVCVWCVWGMRVWV